MDEKQRRKFATRLVKDCERLIRLHSYTRLEAVQSVNGELVPGHESLGQNWTIRVERGAYTVSVNGYELDFHITPRGPIFYAEFFIPGK